MFTSFFRTVLLAIITTFLVCLFAWAPIFPSISWEKAESLQGILANLGEVLLGSWAILVGGCLFALEIIDAKGSRYRGIIDGDSPLSHKASTIESDWRAIEIELNAQGLVKDDLKETLASKMAYFSSLAKETENTSKAPWVSRNLTRWEQAASAAVSLDRLLRKELPSASLPTDFLRERVRSLVASLSQVIDIAQVNILRILRSRSESLLRFGFGFLLSQTLVAFWPDPLLYKTLEALPWPEWSGLRWAGINNEVPSGTFLLFLIYVLSTISVSALLLMQCLGKVLFSGEGVHSRVVAGKLFVGEEGGGGRVGEKERSSDGE